MKSGFVSFIGRPNAGKSTLMNRLLGEKLAIVSDKPQTTRHRLVGILSDERGQMVIYDTPGIHKPLHRLNVRMVNAAFEAMRDVDVLALIVDATVKTGPGDEFLLKQIAPLELPILLALNKVDRIPKTALLPMIDRYRTARPFAEIVPISAVDGTNVDTFERLGLSYLPEGDPLYPSDYVTDQPERTFVSEIVREQVLRLTHDELPFSTAVTVDHTDDSGESGLLRLHCTIFVERESQKAIVVGKGGSMIKEIGTGARVELERFFGTRVFLDLHVKVRTEWRDDERALDELGIHRDR